MVRSSREPVNDDFPGAEPGVPSDVCMLRVAAGRPAGGDCCDGAFTFAFLDFDLKRNDMAQSMLATSTTRLGLLLYRRCRRDGSMMCWAPAGSMFHALAL